MTEEVKASLGQLAGAVVKIRDEISKIQKEADKKIAKLKEDKEKVGEALDYVLDSLFESEENFYIACVPDLHGYDFPGDIPTESLDGSGYKSLRMVMDYFELD